MSVEIVLIPLAIAAASAWKASRPVGGSGSTYLEVGTRMRDRSLLRQALGDVGATVSDLDVQLQATWDMTTATMTQAADGIWTAHFPGGTQEEHATKLLRDLDTAYARRVQEAVVARLRERASSAGMTIESERIEPDHTVTLVFNVARGS